MKNVILTTTFASMFAFSAVVSAAEDIHANQVKVPFYGNQQRLNDHNDSMFKKRMEVEKHLQGSVNENRGRIDHLQRSDNNHNDWTQRQEDRLNQHDEDIGGLYTQVENLEGWTDRQEGAIRSINQGQSTQNKRLDEIDSRNDRQDGSIDNAHDRIGGVIDQANTDRERITENEARTNINTGLSEANSNRNDELESRADTADNERQVLTDRADRADVERSDLYSTVDTVDSDSRQRDQVLQNQVDETRNAVVNVDNNSRDRDAQIVQEVRDIDQWNVEQFNRHANAINGVRSDVAQVKQDLANERRDRKEQGKDLTAGVANAIAIGSHHFDTNYQGFQMSLSGGAYRGESAVSLSAGGAFTESVFGSISVSNDSRGHQGIGANTTWKF